MHLSNLCHDTLASKFKCRISISNSNYRCIFKLSIYFGAVTIDALINALMR